MAVAVIVLPIACSRGQPEERLDFPTAERLAPRPNAVGIPYGRFLLLRYKGQLFAINIRSAGGVGERIAYDWYLADSDGDFSSAEDNRQGRGETTENPYTGRISLPGGLSLEWSRGSRRSGWLYWPRQGPELEVFSETFADLSTVDPTTRAGRWLNRPDAEK